MQNTTTCMLHIVNGPESLQSIKTKKGGRKMEDDVEVRNDSQQLQKTRAQDVKEKMSSPTINGKEKQRSLE